MEVCQKKRLGYREGEWLTGGMGRSGGTPPACMQKGVLVVRGSAPGRRCKRGR